MNKEMKFSAFEVRSAELYVSHVTRDLASVAR